jgi:glycosyltransferase involved in cell wall biosynthesis
MLTNTSQLYSEKPLFDCSVIIPVYNNQEKIMQAINSIKTGLLPYTASYEIIVVNDGSTDKTLSILETAKESDQNMRILSYPNNSGKGHAVKTGVLACQGSNCLFIDGDLDISACGIVDFLRELETCDMAVASKRHALSIVKASKKRKFLSLAFNFFVRLTTGIPVKDTQSGLKAGRSLKLKEIFSSMTTTRYAFDVELLMLASKTGLRIKEMPVNMTLEGKFKRREIIRMLADVLRISYRYRILRQMPLETAQYELPTPVCVNESNFSDYTSRSNVEDFSKISG